MHAEWIEYHEKHDTNVGTNQHHHDENGVVMVRTEFVMYIPGRIDPNNEKEKIDSTLLLRFATGIAYGFPDSMDETSRVVFGKVNAVMHSWPYFRTFALGSMAQMNLMGTIMPLLQVPQAAKMAGFPPPPDDAKKVNLGAASSAP
ncbi:MAG TPA: hypothetical protein VHN77_08225 [Phycisphaerales bacterium]|nr:hypothetical protein [Phycisphaerales bacterium]